jgi:hypothetical protein
MLRVKRSVEAQFSQVHFNTADIVQENTEELIPEDPMALAESQVANDRKRKAEVESGKKPRLGASAVDKKEMLAEFMPSKTFSGARPGFVFKLGAQGLGYYKDLNERELDAAEAKASKNDEEIDLDLDLEDMPAEVGAPASLFGGLAEGSAAPAEGAAPKGALARFQKKKD